MTRCCTFPGCGGPHKALGYCRSHYRQHQRGQELRPISVPRGGRSDGTIKRCSRCLRDLPVTDYNVNARMPDGLFNACRSCERWRQVEQTFNITRAEYEALLREQDGMCATCGATEIGRPRGTWCIDHDHRCCPGIRSCGWCVRGLLCFGCNVRLMPGYESLPSGRRDSPGLNKYLDERPIAAMRRAVERET